MAVRLAALANPHRLRVLALLQRKGRNYVSELARQLGLSRPLLHLHLAKLSEAGFVASQMELSADGKALHYFEVQHFQLSITPESIMEVCSDDPGVEPAGNPQPDSGGE